MRDRLPHPQILELRIAHVELEIEHGAAHRVAIGGHIHLGNGFQPLEVAKRHRIGTADFDLAGLEGNRAGAGVWNEADDHFIDEGFALAPVVRVAFEP